MYYDAKAVSLFISKRRETKAELKITAEKEIQAYVQQGQKPIMSILI